MALVSVPIGEREGDLHVTLRGRLTSVLRPYPSAVLTTEVTGTVGEDLGKMIAEALPEVYFDRDVEVVVRWRP